MTVSVKKTLNRNVEASLRIVLFLKMANAGNAGLVYHMLSPLGFDPFWLNGWLLCAFSCAAFLAVHAFWSLKHPEFIQDSEWSQRAAVTASLGLGALWGALAIYVLPALDQDKRQLFCLIYSSLMSCGSLTMYALPPSAYSHVIVLTLAGVVALQLTNDTYATTTCVLILAYALVIGVLIYNVSRTLITSVESEARAEERQEIIAMMLHDFEENASDWLWETDAAGHVIHGSDRMAEILGRPVASLVGANLVTLVGAESDEHSAELASHLKGRAAFSSLKVAATVPLKSDRPVSGVKRFLPTRYERRWWSLTAKPILDGSGLVVGWRGVGSDVTEAHLRAEELTQAATVDALTGLANRRQFLRHLEGVTAGLEAKQNVAGGLFFINLDNFKAVNDALGHPTGDRILHLVGQRLRAVTGADDVLARLGGDEYVIIHSFADGTSNTEYKTRAANFANGLLAALREPCLVDGVRIEVRASIGGIVYPLQATTAVELMKRAAAALYASKNGGRDLFRLYDDEIGSTSTRRSRVLSDLGSALENDQLTILLQPQFRFGDNKILGFEALLRWNHPVHGVLSPEDFLTAAEETGIVLTIGSWVLRQACKVAARVPGDFDVAINMTALQVRSRDLQRTVTSALASSGLPASRLVLEVDERAIGGAHQGVIERLETLREQGVRIVLENFGAGQHSLSMLRRVPLDGVKIDPLLVSNLAECKNGDELPVLQALVQYAKKQGLSVMGKCIETQAQLDALFELGCCAGQGFLLKAPMPPECALALLPEVNLAAHT